MEISEGPRELVDGSCEGRYLSRVRCNRVGDLCSVGRRPEKIRYGGRKNVHSATYRSDHVAQGHTIAWSEDCCLNSLSPIGRKLQSLRIVRRGLDVGGVQARDCYVVKVLDGDDHYVGCSDGSRGRSAGLLDDDVRCEGIVEVRHEIGLRARCYVEVVG